MINLDFQSQLPNDFDEQSRVWIYQCSRLLSISEVLNAESRINDFVQSWTSHGIPVKGFGTILFGRFFVLIADESAHGVSGCSTDSSVRFIKELETIYGVQLFDRTQLCFIVKDTIQMLPLSQFTYAWDNGFIKKDTPYFNNTVSTLKELRSKWLIPTKQSWLASKFRIVS